MKAVVSIMANNNIINLPLSSSKETKEKHYYGKNVTKDPRKNVMPRCTVEARTVLVNLAVGMYQFHDLMASRGSCVPKKGEIGLINL